VAAREAEHDYRKCPHKDDCRNYPCRVFREGYQLGYQHGYMDGALAGYQAGYAEGFKAGQHSAHADS
jgi:flagellar biosynthesis/type III secretory pathway protein FliH